MRRARCIGKLTAAALLCAACAGRAQAPDERLNTADAAVGSTGAEASTSSTTAGDSQTGEVDCTGEVQLDPVIEAYVRRMHGPKEGPISGDKLAEVTSLSPSEAVSSLAGVECMVNLAVMLLVPGSVESLEPLSGLSRLVNVSFSRNNVRDLTPLNGKPELARISVIGNAVEELEGLELPQGDCPRLWLTDNPLRESAEVVIDRLCSDGWFVVWGSGKDITSCNPQCAPRP